MQIMLHQIIFFLFLNYLSVQNTKAQDFMKLSQDKWTTCPEFLRNTKFDHKTVLDKDWKVFYLWSYPDDYSHQVRFRVPPPALIARYKDLLYTYMNPPNISWSDAVLFIETSQDYSGLLLKTNTSGLFKLLLADHIEFPAENSPAQFYAMKLVGNILGLMNCMQKLCYALAPLDNFPKEDELVSAAAKLGFYSEIGHSYLARSDVGLYTDSILAEKKKYEEDELEDDFDSDPIFDDEDLEI